MQYYWTTSEMPDFKHNALASNESENECPLASANVVLE
jgi:hypothetical protein